MDEQSGVYKFASIGELAETTTQMLSLGLQYKTRLSGRAPVSRQSGLERMEQIVLQQARDYLSEVREGFVLSVRTTRVESEAELHFLLERVLLDWKALSQELGLASEGPEQEQTDDAPRRLERVRQQLLAYSMAAVALGYLPHLPAEQITFPYSYSNPPTYSDILSPDSAGEMLWRIEELEQMLWQLMAGDLQGLVERRYGALRRTYGFFETSALLANREAERFGVKKRQKRLALL
ncbi:MAG: hypothetical protein DCC55_06375 [Chloroflexi bacterium]|nr:MAG: hypothetical protein DCC55_06375 [Chloroflexota bacterium]